MVLKTSMVPFDVKSFFISAPVEGALICRKLCVEEFYCSYYKTNEFIHLTIIYLPENTLIFNGTIIGCLVVFQ